MSRTHLRATKRAASAALFIAAFAATCTASARSDRPDAPVVPSSHRAAPAQRAPGTLRIATYNASLNRARDGELRRDLAGGRDAQARRIATVIRILRPDVLLINEFDFDEGGESARLFEQAYLAAPLPPDAAARSTAPMRAPPLRFAARYLAPVNTGVPTGLDLDNDGRSGSGGGDAFGFGAFPGQYGMVVYSQLPIERQRVRTFQRLRWASMPNASWPDDPSTPEPADWYSPAEKAVLRLSSKSHWDLPLRLPGGAGVLHLLVSHPTPPAFDGPEDRNGLRNHDEIRLWADYLSPERAAWIVDDAGLRGGLAADAEFVIAGDLNADPDDGASHAHAIRQILEHPRLNADAARGARVPASAGGAAAALRQGGVNATHRGDPHFDTADFGDAREGAAGNLRTDYVLPSRGLAVCASGVFWPTPDDPNWALVNDDTAATSDHRLVWIDVAIGGACPR